MAEAFLLSCSPPGFHTSANSTFSSVSQLQLIAIMTSLMSEWALSLVEPIFMLKLAISRKTTP